MAKIQAHEHLRHWLEGRPREVAVVIAARAALRTVPLLSRALGTPGQLTGKLGRDTVLSVFRGIAAPWAAGAWPARNADLSIAAAYTEATIAAYAVVPSAARAAEAAKAAAHAAATADAAATAAAAADAADATANGAHAAASDPTYAGHAYAASAAYAAAWAAVSADASALEPPPARALRPINLAIQGLWPTGTPAWVIEDWQRLRRALLAAEEDWEVWTDWYEARLEGARVSGMPNEALEIARVLIPKNIWQHGPKVVNPHIKRLIEERGIFEYAVGNEPQRDRKPPEVPAQRRAAVEPIWIKGRLTIARKSAEVDLNKKEFTAALSALRTNLGEFADAIADEANIDKRFISFVRTLAEQIPTKTPAQQQLFQLGHVEDVFSEYAATVDDEWPRILASRYHAVSLQFDRTMRQSPLWREFKRNAAKETLSAEQIAASMPLAIEAARALRQDEATEFVEPELPNSLEHLANILPVAAANAREGALDAVEAGKELLAADLIESVNNALKPIAEVALSAGGDYGRGFGKGFKKAAKQQGPKDGEKTFKWLRRIVLTGAAGTGSFAALSQLITKYPQAFAWLERVLHFLN